MSLIFHIVSPKYDVIATSWLLSFSITSTNNKIIENYSKKKNANRLKNGRAVEAERMSSCSLEEDLIYTECEEYSI